MTHDLSEGPLPNPELPLPLAAGIGPAADGAAPQLRSLTLAMAQGIGGLMAAGVIARLFSVASSPILTRLVGPSPYGVLALIGTVSSLAASVSLVGIDLAYARFFFGARGEQASAVEGFCWRFALALGLLFSLTAGAAWWWMVPPGSAHRSLAPVAGLTTLVAVATVMAMTRQRISGAYTRVAAATLVGSGAGAMLSVLLAKFWRPDAWAMLTGTLAGSILALGVLGLPRASLLLKRSSLDSMQRRGLLSLGLASTVTAPMFWVINSADRWLLGIWTGSGSVGVYAFAGSLGLSGLMVTNAVSLAWFPEVSREFEAFGASAPSNIARLWARLAGLYMVTWLAITAAGGDAIRWLADSRFHSGARLIPWIAGGVFFYGMAGLANTGLFLKKDLKPGALWWAVGAGFNVVCNAFLIRPMGMLGAAITATLTFALIMCGMLWSAQSRLHLPLPWGRLGAATALSVAAGGLMQIPWSGSSLVSLSLKFPVGILVSAVIGRILAPDWVNRVINKIGVWLS